MPTPKRQLTKPPAIHMVQTDKILKGRTAHLFIGVKWQRKSQKGKPSLVHPLTLLLQIFTGLYNNRLTRIRDSMLGHHRAATDNKEQTYPTTRCLNYRFKHSSPQNFHPMLSPHLLKLRGNNDSSIKVR